MRRPRSAVRAPGRGSGAHAPRYGRSGRAHVVGGEERGDEASPGPAASHSAALSRSTPLVAPLRNGSAPAASAATPGRRQGRGDLTSARRSGVRRASRWECGRRGSTPRRARWRAGPPPRRPRRTRKRAPCATAASASSASARFRRRPPRPAAPQLGDESSARGVVTSLDDAKPRRRRRRARGARSPRRCSARWGGTLAADQLDEAQGSTRPHLSDYARLARASVWSRHRRHLEDRRRLHHRGRIGGRQGTGVAPRSARQSPGPAVAARMENARWSSSTR